MSGATHNYKFGPKNNWRRRVWNSIVERLLKIGIKPRDATVLYLAGESDLDRGVALEKGFQPNNLIAVERDSKVVQALRHDRKLVISGNILDVVEAWRGQPAHVLFADLCCGFSVDAAVMVSRLPYIDAFSNCVCAINLMRGRESWGQSPEAKQAVKQFHGTHRGLSAVFFGIQMLERLNEKSGVLTDKNYAAFCGWVEQNPPACFSYPSTSGQVFDSAVWRNYSPIGFFQEATQQQITKLKSLGYDGHLPPEIKMAKSDLSNRMTRQIAAVRATRTRYLNS